MNTDGNNVMPWPVVTLYIFGALLVILGFWGALTPEPWGTSAVAMALICLSGAIMVSTAAAVHMLGHNDGRNE